MVNLNLCGGDTVIPGYRNLDIKSGQDLEQGLKPFVSGTMDSILIDNGLEHISHRTRLLCDCLDVLKPGGMIRVIVPLFNESVFHTKCYWTLDSLNQLHQYGDVMIRKHLVFRKWVIVRNLKRLRDWLLSLFFVSIEYEVVKK